MSVLVSGILAILASQAQPEDWVDVAEYDGSPIALDRASVRREGNIVTLRSRTIFAQAQQDGTKTVLVQFRYDCGARTSDLMSIHTLREDGSTVAREEVPQDQRQVEPVSSGSPNAAIADVVCRR